MVATMAVERDARGRVLPGKANLNPRGRPPDPPWLAELADTSFRYIAEVGAGLHVDSVDPKLRMQAAIHVVERYWGAAPKARVDEIAEARSEVLEVLLALAGNQSASPTPNPVDNAIDVTPVTKDEKK